MLLAERTMAMAGIVVLSLGCHGGPSQEPRHTPPRLVASDGSLYIIGAPDGAKRGYLYVVLSDYFIPGTQERRPVALVQGLDHHGDSLKAAEICHVPSTSRSALVKGGLLVVPMAEDTRARIDKCITSYSLSDGGWDSSRPVVELWLDVGVGDGVQPGDRYEIWGDGVADDVNMTVTGFDVLGQCTVQPDVGQGRALCRLNHRQWPGFTRDRALRGGIATIKSEQGY